MIELLCENVNTPLRVYFHSLFSGDHFEFRIYHFSETYVYGYPQTYFGFYQSSMMEFLWQNLTEFDLIGPKILLAFLKI